MLYRRPRQLTGEQLRLAEAVASMAIATITYPQTPDWSVVRRQIVDVLGERITVEQAKGVLAVRHQIELPQAFTRLRQDAGQRGRSLSAQAAHVVASVGRTED